MSAEFKILERKDVNAELDERDQFAQDTLAGLLSTPKTFSSKYFYDAKGSELFTAITDLPEYYLTKCEYEILNNEKARIAKYMEGERYNLVELGAGDGKKTRILLQYLLENNIDFRYIPIDISPTYVENLVTSLEKEFPKMEIFGIVSDYFEGMKWIHRNSSHKIFALMLGSNVGNFSLPQIDAFFRSLWFSLDNGDYVFTGFDLVKDIDTLVNAYSDKQGVTAEFNYNLLRRMNKELGANFNVDQFRHYASYDFIDQKMESYLVSLVDQTVEIKALEKKFEFKAWEAVHMEFSRKFSIEKVAAIADRSGFEVCDYLYDDQKFFCDSIWKVKKHQL